jgi:UDP-N-acetylglucosamine 4,6-dehydratase
MLQQKSVIKSMTLKNKVIFLTGGTGSFGRFFTAEALKRGAKKIIIFSRDEDKQYSMQFDFRKFEDRLEFVIGDVRDISSLMGAVRGGEIDIFVHAAALKQIPSTEYNILEAVKTNVLGAQNVVDVCIEAGIPKSIGVTTDKVVEPVNAYGMTKALQEKIFILGNKRARAGKTRFACIRYGNVINSRGSVIPLFKKQLEAGAPITITHKDMTRFILPLSEATNLVITSIERMKGGETFVPKIKPIKIIDLAETMIEEFMPKNSKIVEIGVRPGEKIHETLISVPEWAFTEEFSNYFIVHPQINLKGVGFNYDVITSKKPIIDKYSSDQGPFLTKPQILKILKEEKIF